MKYHFPLATLAGILTWLLVSGITLMLLLRLPAPQPLLPASLLLLVYGISFILLTQEQHPLGLGGCYRCHCSVPLPYSGYYRPLFLTIWPS